MRRVLMVAALALTPIASSAHDFTELQIDSFSRIGDGPYFEIILGNTAKGRQVVCALQDSSGKVLATTVWNTDNLATKVLINYEGSNIATARCVFND